MKISINNEYDQLKKVVVSSAESYDPSTIALNNETIKYYAENGGVPTKEAILKEQKNFWNTLKDLNVEVLIAEQVEGAKGQMFTRDLAFVIGNKFFISNMRKENRAGAINGWKHIINQIDANNIIKVPSNVYLEGGDVIIDNKTIYVGISERTNMEGVEFLRSALDESYTIIPLQLKPKFLHLDVVLTIINPKLAIVYKAGLEEKSYKLLESYHKIEITEKEQFELATNVFVINPETIIMNSHHTRLANELEKLGKNIIPLDLSETAKDGGAFRCTTCPLERVPKN